MQRTASMQEWKEFDGIRKKGTEREQKEKYQHAVVQEEQQQH
jgi:hypothetical protein